MFCKGRLRNDFPEKMVVYLLFQSQLFYFMPSVLWKTNVHLCKSLHFEFLVIIIIEKHMVMTDAGNEFYALL